MSNEDPIKRFRELLSVSPEDRAMHELRILEGLFAQPLPWEQRVKPLFPRDALLRDRAKFYRKLEAPDGRGLAKPDRRRARG